MSKTIDKTLSMSPNTLVGFLGKPAAQFTKADIIRFIREQEIQMVNFMYPAGDGRLKTLNFVINNEEYLETILSYGERVDGSSLFPFIEAGNSDLYVLPRFRTAFVDPFASLPTLTMLCSFFDKEGKPLTYYIYNNCSHEAAYKETGMQAVSYTTGVPAMTGAMMFLKGLWKKPGVYNVEEFDPDPFLDVLNHQGLPWHEIFNGDLEL